MRFVSPIAVMSAIALAILATRVCRSAERVDLTRQDSGDRIAVVSGETVSYLPARRVELVASVGGAGHARYIRRASNGDLYVTGAGLQGTLLHSTDGGSTWTSKSYSIDEMRFLSAFTILRDDTFVIVFMPPGKHRVFIAHSQDLGQTWSTTQPQLDLSPYTEAYAYNSHLLERADGELLLTLDLRAGPDAVKDGSGNDLPLALRGSIPHLFRSSDGGQTWREKSLITMYGGEAHLLELPDGHLLQCVRKQRWHRLPSDPAQPIDTKLRYGYRPQFDSEERASEDLESTNRVKNMFLSESRDGGRTWTDERQVTSFLQCSGDMALLPDGTLVLEYLHRYPDDVANTGIRTRISDDSGKTWREETYILSQGNSTDMDSGSCYPGTIAMPDGTLISICANWVNGRTRLEAVHWKPRPAPVRLARKESRQERQTFVNSLGMKMIEVHAQSFDTWTPDMTRYSRMMQSGEMSDVAFALNRPRVPVRVEMKEDFYLAEFVVTNGMYRQFVKATGYRQPHGKLVDFFWLKKSGAPWEMAGFAGDNLPVTGVNNEDAQAFCRWLSEREGRKYRLPRYYEFECANRAGTNQRFWWGERPDVRKMNFGKSLIGHPTPVGSYPPNPWGFYDLHGNVWQYCINDGPTDAAGRGRWGGWGSAFNSPSRMTGADAWSNFNEGPNLMKLLSAGFRLACSADQGAPRPGDLKKPTVVAAGGQGLTLPELEITVGKRIDMGSIPTNAAFFMVTGRGTWILNNKRSTDRGKTWQACEQIGEAFCQLRDGTIISMPSADSGGGRVTFGGPLNGKATIPGKVSTDDWQTVEKYTANIEIPLAEFFLAVRGLVEMPDGRLLMTMYGRMHGDRVREDSPVGFELSNPWIKTRVIIVQSRDRGQNWQYLSTVSYNPQLGFEGQNETDLIQLPNGLLAAFMRTGIHGYVDKHGRENLDQPLLVAWSADSGLNWSEPQRIYVANRLIPGIYPRALRTEQNVLAVLRCRPDGSVIFSPDGNGAFWSDEHVYYRPGGDIQHAGMQDMALIGPHTILVTDVIRKGGWHVEGVPITVRLQAAKD
ncbi:MAG: SUMF1/EgtB/PvdO family nonheme iron enzyme [Planctomycetota bacterium]|nr:SUMF1/EgtB/PvdO family nonheme iron enzyme [Planctomycetota bacterium]